MIFKKKENKIISKKKTKTKNNETERSKEEVENNLDGLLDYLLDYEDKISKLLTDLKYEKHDTLNNITVLELKLKKMETSPTRIDKINNSILS